MRFKLLKTKMLTTATFGEETFDIEDFCAETGDYFGFTFYNRYNIFYSVATDCFCKIQSLKLVKLTQLYPGLAFVPVCRSGTERE